MRYYTKEWYELMQGLHYVSGMIVVPDKEYTDAEIQAFYDADLAEEIDRDRSIYEEWQRPFDPAETIQCFEDCYQGVKKYCLNRYPEWARAEIDPRLVALNRITEGIYNRLKAVEDANKAAFDAINAEAQNVMDQQNIPKEIRSIFRFHDAHVLTLKRCGRDAELYLSYGEELPDGKSPYKKVVFKNVSQIDREKGLVFRKKRNEHGIWSSNITYLYDELYRADTGYEVHMLLWSFRGLRYLTIECEDIQFEDNIENIMSAYQYITLRQKPELKNAAAEWFHQKWRVPVEAYLECMDAYLGNDTEYGWYLCMDGEQIIGGMGVIENDFHDRKDLTPNVCAVYTEERYRCQGIAGTLLNLVVEDMRAKGVSPVYLVTDHTGFYEKYGWEFLCMVQGDGEPDMTRMYIHR